MVIMDPRATLGKLDGRTAEDIIKENVELKSKLKDSSIGLMKRFAIHKTIIENNKCLSDKSKNNSIIYYIIERRGKYI